jgi:hypothetical protein
MRLLLVLVPVLALSSPFVLSAQNSFIDMTRATEQSLVDMLHTYTATEHTVQYINTAAEGRNSVWQILTNITTDVSLAGQAEQYRNTLVDGVPTRADLYLQPGLALVVSIDGGLWSTGDFATLVRDLFSSGSGVTFHDLGATKMGERPAVRYSFSVDQSHSPWQIDAGPQSYRPGFSGTTWLDPNDRNAALRIEMKADLPAAFPLQTAELAVDWGTLIVEGRPVLLPTFSESLVCQRGTGRCLRNETAFREYRRSALSN